MLSRLQLRVRNRRSFRKYPLFIGVDPSAYSNAMLGLVLCLLITFMMDTKPHHGTYIDQYRSRNATPMPAALREDALRIMLTRDGSTYFGNSKVANEDVPDQLRQRIKNGSPA